MYGIFLVGASGTGKSRLAKHCSAELGLALGASRTRDVAERHGGFAEINASMATATAFQRDVCRDVADAISRLVVAGKPFICDRSLDHIAYAAIQSDAVRTADRMVRERLGDVMSGRPFPAAVLFCRPDPAVIKAARADGDRAEYLTDEWVYRVDGIIQYALEEARLDYVSVRGGEFADRCRTVRAVVRILKGGAK